MFLFLILMLLLSVVLVSFSNYFQGVPSSIQREIGDTLFLKFDVRHHRQPFEKFLLGYLLVQKFKTKQTREKFYDLRKKTASSKEVIKNVYINDHLTRYRKQLFYSARQLFKRKLVAAALTQQGNVLIRGIVNGPPIQIFSQKDLDQFGVEEILQDSALECGMTSNDYDSLTNLTISDYDFSDPGFDD